MSGKVAVSSPIALGLALTMLGQSWAVGSRHAAPNAGPNGCSHRKPNRKAVNRVKNVLVVRSRAWGEIGIRHRTAQRLVPPPPPDMPSILPELEGKRWFEAGDAQPENPYRKYVYTREGYAEPIPEKKNEHVTYWNRRP